MRLVIARAVILVFTAFVAVTLITALQNPRARPPEAAGQILFPKEVKEETQLFFEHWHARLDAAWSRTDDPGEPLATQIEEGLLAAEEMIDHLDDLDDEEEDEIAWKLLRDEIQTLLEDTERAIAEAQLRTEPFASL